MNNKFNIALVPKKASDQIISLAKRLAPIADQYILGEKSLPHVTLCQFTATSTDLKNQWKAVRESIINDSLVLQFEKLSCLHINHSNWVSLLPDKIAELTLLHEAVLKHIKHPVKKYSDQYDPHMTLINTQVMNYKEQANQLLSPLTPIQDTFVLTLGRADSIGQLIEIISDL
ncbi:MAG: hypothetical protein P4M14_11425 [Gammaproteobacteria bacterium]|nr:hypothetical protein [Gammaproteobacteria bacterium]